MRRIFLLPIAVLNFAASGFFVYLYNRTDSLSLRYILWKNGICSYSTQFYPSLSADTERSIFVRGKTKEEILTMFPDAHENPVDEYQAYYEKSDLREREHLWIGKSNLIIFLENGIGKQVSLMKR